MMIRISTIDDIVPLLKMIYHKNCDDIGSIIYIFGTFDPDEITLFFQCTLLSLIPKSIDTSPKHLGKLYQLSNIAKPRFLQTSWNQKLSDSVKIPESLSIEARILHGVMMKSLQEIIYKEDINEFHHKIVQFIEDFDNQESFLAFMKRNRNKRVDKLVFVLVHDVEYYLIQEYEHGMSNNGPMSSFRGSLQTAWRDSLKGQPESILRHLVMCLGKCHIGGTAWTAWAA
ncbi:hypothetical protein PHYBLDRAFT_174679 [Phycomyces blakesleeanus NRRL 1555(-)]|uniref:Uncharacterized protein n=1 Tax=Phycomyces blakesleeanus (strain ATCC 8743b / DSM 1359 / FGSC 10004 / NBRC 33097 / NRRL 1555) TaxID=763407 RepID=A0A162ZI98_PHYB8|nr:hypothetical protein PHYBLDRAFT_174679 [Phycomyces blakesleeanus NRRL 1555(-)]OAD66971.1 hypothetical protein PHYBLDRAFT_174679 [Phycomyces blakesleeanus NRRL 1555(-)]|eukprot:XP_018285011.1 hypothetical protein PHYBLDRAFT_174679 [Phycomyces blakesleeanus NRRL 1555(-)]